MMDEPTSDHTLRWWIESLLLGLVLIGIFKVVSTIVRALLPEAWKESWVVFIITPVIVFGGFFGIAEAVYGSNAPKHHPSANYTPQQMRAYVDRKCTQIFTELTFQDELDSPDRRRHVYIEFQCRFHDEGDMPTELTGRAMLDKFSWSTPGGNLRKYPFDTQGSRIGYNQYYTDDAAQFQAPSFRTSTDKDAHITDKTRTRTQLK